MTSLASYVVFLVGCYFGFLGIGSSTGYMALLIHIYSHRWIWLKLMAKGFAW